MSASRIRRTRLRESRVSTRSRSRTAWSHPAHPVLPQSAHAWTVDRGKYRGRRSRKSAICVRQRDSAPIAHFNEIVRHTGPTRDVVERALMLVGLADPTFADVAWAHM